MTLERSAKIVSFLEAAGWAGAERAPLAGDASTRRYERLRSPDGRRAILMDAPRSAETGPCPLGAGLEERRALGWNATSRLAASRVEAFAAVAAYLAGLGVSTPEIFAINAPEGLALLEDFGDDVFARIIQGPAQEAALYAAAGEVLASVQAQPPPNLLHGKGGDWPLLEFDALALEVNADLFSEWLPRAGVLALSEADRARFEGVRDGLIAQALACPRALTIRDYHAENLIWLADRAGLRRVGLLDFQDAVLGFRGWDLSMLLHDARRDVSPAAAAAALAAFAAAADADPEALAAETALLGGLNCLRILGVFARLSARDGKSRYLDFMPRMWAHLSRVLEHSGLAELHAFLREVAGERLRGAA